ncbi:hypothetical protein VNI00_008351 [Paramarasmius palmivorus]|uniref:RNA-dependent RNA polymerase n=1 Tax=Paramarasmius palmivorus TaxID=297713 RepID=A0AAW0CUW1_9AGAR
MSQSTIYDGSSDDELFAAVPSQLLGPSHPEDAPRRPNLPTTKAKLAGPSTSKGLPSKSHSGNWRSISACTPSPHDPSSASHSYHTGKDHSSTVQSLPRAGGSRSTAAVKQPQDSRQGKGKEKARGTPQRLEHIRQALKPASAPAALMPVDQGKGPAVLSKAVANIGHSLSTPTKNRRISATGNTSGSRPREVFEVSREHRDKLYSISDSDEDVTMRFEDDSSNDSDSGESLFDAGNAPASATTSRTTSFASVNQKSPRKRPSTERPKSPTASRIPKVARTHRQKSPSHSRAPTASPEKVERMLFPTPTPSKPSTSAARIVQSNHADQSILEQIWDTVDLPTCLVAHNKEAQRLFDNPKTCVGWGTQFNLARGVVNGDWTWEDVVKNIGKLTGTDSEKMHLVSEIMLGIPHKTDDSIGKELDREQAAILENCGRGLGLMGEWQGEEDWYGGQVQFIVAFDWKTNKFQLEPVEMQRSTRFARMVGSRRLVRIRVGSYSSREVDEVKRRLAQKFIINGRVFVPLPPKDDAFYAMEVNEDYERKTISELGDNFRWSLGQFLNWHNPLELNSNQPVAKYFARTALGLSTSMPVLEFDEENIEYIPDEVIPGEYDGKPPAEKVLTDGCGLMNNAALVAIAKATGSATTSAAVQGRIGGAKGLWILDVNDNSPVPRIWIRDSQNKIKYDKLDRAHRIFDLLTASHPLTQASLSTQSVTNLSANGVPSDVFKGLMREGMEKLTDSLTAWGRHENDMVALWDSIGRLSSTSAARAARIAASLSRALGLSRRPKDSVQFDLDLGQADDDEGSPDSTIAGRGSDTGLPESWSEVAQEMLQSGFHPLDCAYLAEKIEWILNNAIKKAIDKCIIPLPEGDAFEGFVIPDPFGILEPDEIYYRSSTGWIDPETRVVCFTAIGDTLLGRFPVRLPSDIQKFKAVDRPEFSRFQDVIIVSSKPVWDENVGFVSVMSRLAGGDYDGDMDFGIRHASIVNSFKSQPVTINPEPIEKYFDKNIEHTSGFTARLQAMDTWAAQVAFLSTCIAGLKDPRLGMISKFADAARDGRGYDSKEHIILSYVFNTLMDAPKTGRMLKAEAYEKFQKEYTTNQNLADKSRRSVLADLKRFATKLQEDNVKRYKEVLKGVSEQNSDVALLKPMQDAENRMRTSKIPGVREAVANELYRIQEQVRAELDRYKEVSREAARDKNNNSKGPETPQKIQKAKKLRNKKRKQDVARRYHQPLDGIECLNVDEVKAAYAYHQNPRFAFDVAFQTLTCLKARSMPGGLVASTRRFDEMRALSSAGKKFLKQQQARPDS